MTHTTKVHKFPSKLKANSLHGDLPTTLIEDYMTEDQAMMILDRANMLYQVMLDNEELIRSVYGEKTTRLIDNFRQILNHVDDICALDDVNDHADYFGRLSLFCGQVEQISKLLRYYRNL